MMAQHEDAFSNGLNKISGFRVLMCCGTVVKESHVCFRMLPKPYRLTLTLLAETPRLAQATERPSLTP